MRNNSPIREGQILEGSLFNEPMRVETVKVQSAEAWIVGLVGKNSERYRKVTLTTRDLENLRIIDSVLRFDGNGKQLVY